MKFDSNDLMFDGHKLIRSGAVVNNQKQAVVLPRPNPSGRATN
jgi:hypothetical protein